MIKTITAIIALLIATPAVAGSTGFCGAIVPNNTALVSEIVEGNTAAEIKAKWTTTLEKAGHTPTLRGCTIALAPSIAGTLQRNMIAQLQKEGYTILLTEIAE